MSYHSSETIEVIVMKHGMVIVWGSYHAKFDDNDFNNFRGIACRDTQTDRQTDFNLICVKVVSDFDFENNKTEKQVEPTCDCNLFLSLCVIMLYLLMYFYAVSVN